MYTLKTWPPLPRHSMVLLPWFAEAVFRLDYLALLKILILAAPISSPIHRSLYFSNDTHTPVLQGWYPTGQASPSDMFNPSNALVKAMVVASGTGMAAYDGIDTYTVNDGVLFLCCVCLAGFPAGIVSPARACSVCHTLLCKYFSIISC